MESAQREPAGVLPGHIHSLVLISNFTCSKAMALVHSVIGFPELFQYPVCLTKEARIREYTQDTE